MSHLVFKSNACVCPSGAEDDEWDDDWDDVKSSGGYAESEAGDSGAMQRGGAHGTSMKIALNK